MSNDGRPRVTVRALDGRRLLGVSRTHAVVLDRPLDEGGTDCGFTSGEMLLLALGSCCTGSLRNYFDAQGRSRSGLEVAVGLQAPREAGDRDRIIVTLKIDPRDPAEDPQEIKRAALSGGVASRLIRGSELEVRFADERA